MRLRVAAVTILIAAAPFSRALAVDDAEMLTLMQKHCVMCHAAKPTHESFQEAPKNIALETIAGIKKYAATISAQTVQTKAMPLGNQTGMTDEERATLAQWLKNQPRSATPGPGAYSPGSFLARWRSSLASLRAWRHWSPGTVSICGMYPC